MILALIVLVFLATGILAALGALADKANPRRGTFFLSSGIALVLGVILLVGSVCTVVSTRNYGVVTTFGKPSGRVLGNGLHLKAPWQKVTDIDGTIETQKFVGRSANKNQDTLGCIGVRISDGSTACVSVVIRTRVDQAHADEIFTDYRNSDKDINENVNDSLVRTQLTSALASAFTDFNPLLVPGSVDSSASTEQSAPDLQKYAKDVRAQMRDRLDAQSNDGKAEVDVTGLTISYIYLSDSTQRRLNQLQAEVANTRISKQREATAEAEARANRKLSASVSKDPNVLVSKCIDALNSMVEKGEPVPAGFSCWPGGGSALVVPSTK